MAAPLPLTIVEGRHAVLTLEPMRDCPLEPGAWPKPRCATTRRDSAIVCCPFAAYTEAYVLGNWVRHGDITACYTDIHLTSDRVGTFRVICLAADMTDCKAGAQL